MYAAFERRPDDDSIKVETCSLDTVMIFLRIQFLSVNI